MSSDDYSKGSSGDEDGGGLEEAVAKILTFPRIEVGEDSIVVLESEEDDPRTSANEREQGEKAGEESGWIERDVSGELDVGEMSGSEEDEKYSGADRVAGILGVEEVSVLVESDLEAEVSEGSRLQVAGSREGREDFYSTGRARTDDFYDVKEKYDAKVSIEAEEVRAAGVYGMVEKVEVVDFEEERRGGRSVLEITGFKDEEAEKRRKSKRDSVFG